jgi:hypothetical protein
MAKAQGGDLDLFDEARYHIWDLLYYDAYSRYILSPDFETIYQNVCRPLFLGFFLGFFSSVFFSLFFFGAAVRFSLVVLVQ